MAVEFRFKQKFFQKQLDEGRSITQAEVARAVGVTREAVRQWISTETISVRLDTLDKLCAYFQCEPGDLLVRVPDEGVGVPT